MHGSGQQSVCCGGSMAMGFVACGQALGRSWEAGREGGIPPNAIPCFQPPKTSPALARLGAALAGWGSSLRRRQRGGRRELLAVVQTCPLPSAVGAGLFFFACWCCGASGPRAKRGAGCSEEPQLWCCCWTCFATSPLGGANLEVPQLAALQPAGSGAPVPPLP